MKKCFNFFEKEICCNRNRNNNGLQLTHTSQPIPRLKIEGGTGVALPYLAVARNEPVDCACIKGFVNAFGQELKTEKN